MLEKATLGGGCFWCLEAVYDRVIGVQAVESGYSGGETVNPTYEEVCSKRTGHAEVVQITYDNDIISYREILQIFFSIHDPTTKNRQGNDIGPQYRSVIFYHTEEQREIAEAVIREIEAEEILSQLIVTEVSPLEAYYRAEDYHQRYYERNPDQGYCQFVITPKVSKLRKKFADRLKSS